MAIVLRLLGDLVVPGGHQGAGEEVRAGRDLLVGVDLAVGRAGVVVDGGVDGRVESNLDALTDEERDEIRQATSALRRSRAVQLGMPTLRPAAGGLPLEREA
ncbi:hypothetical protein ACFVW8_08400 [Streptomyces sp. NPDC058221]|uniref:hypothetical protein n=1 Tax=Streptomyces sp. NPDC058221 TaxID=3346388 RepID=UPI0036E5FC23